MAQSRLRTAITDGLLVPPAGQVAVLRPPAGYDLAGLPHDLVRISHSFYPDAAAWQAAGFSVTRDIGPAAMAIVVAPRAKQLAQQMIAAACANAQLVVVDAQRTDGADSLFRAVRARLGDLPSLTQAHGRIFWFAASDLFADWAAPALTRGESGFYCAAGVFSDAKVDQGSAQLAAALPPKLPARMADLGAGWGYLAQAVLTRTGVAQIDLIEAEAVSLDCARLNVTDPRASFIWADALTHGPAAAYDGIVMNPPFHTGRATDQGLGRGFIQAAARLLVPNGRLWMVANRHLPYETTLNDSFRSVESIGGTGGFKLFCASKPRR